MNLIPNWKAVLIKAWSVRLIALSGIFDILERALPYIAPSLQEIVPPGVLSGISICILIGAAGARVLAQPEVSNAANPDSK